MYVCAVPFLLTLAGCVFVWTRDEYVLWRELWLCRLSGYASLFFLLVALSITPIRRISAWLRASPPQDWLLSLRRRAGITAALLALVHAGCALLTYLRDSWAVLLEWSFTRAGLLALLVLVLLLVTSFPWIVRLLRVKVWKQLHRLAYVAAFFVFQHIFLAPFSSRWWAIVLLATFLVLIAVRFLPAPKRSRPAT